MSCLSRNMPLFALHAGSDAAVIKQETFQKTHLDIICVSGLKSSWVFPPNFFFFFFILISMPKRIIGDTPPSLRGNRHGPALCKMVWIWHGHRAIMQVRHWPILKNSQKTLRAAATQPVWPSLAVHVVFLFLFCLSPLLFFSTWNAKQKTYLFLFHFKGYLDWVLNSPYFDFKLSFFAQAFESLWVIFFRSICVCLPALAFVTALS